MTEEMVTITKKEYNDLIKDSDILSCLEAGGIDSWARYFDSLVDNGFYERYPDG